MFSPTHTQTHTHTNILSLSWLWVNVRCRGSCMQAQCVCHIRWNHKVMIIGLSCHRRRVSKMCESHFITTDKHHEREEGERKRGRQKKRGGEREGVRKTESLSWRPAVLFTKVWLFIGCRLTERKRLKKREREKGIDRLSVCMCEGVEARAQLCFLHFYSLSPVALLLPCVCVCQIKKVKFEWGTLTGVKMSISTMGWGHTHIHT